MGNNLLRAAKELFNTIKPCYHWVYHQVYHQVYLVLVEGLLKVFKTAKRLPLKSILACSNIQMIR